MVLPPLDPDIHQPTRLRILTLLHRNRVASFAWVRDTLELTDGNLGRHVGRLQEKGYLRQRRALTRRGFETRLSVTPEGEQAFDRYLDVLRMYLREGNDARGDGAQAETAGPIGAT